MTRGRPKETARRPPAIGLKNPRRFADCRPERQRRVCLRVLWSAPHIREALHRARDLEAPDWLLVAGALYNTIWNRLTDRPPTHGLNDIDIAYFDDDLSYEAEDRMIRRAEQVFAGFPIPVEPRNQARVHLWYEQRFGQPYAPLSSTEEALTRYASKTHSIGLRLEADDSLTLVAPFGLRDILDLRLRPNHIIDNRATYFRKAARARELWPELEIAPW